MLSRRLCRSGRSPCWPCRRRRSPSRWTSAIDGKLGETVPLNTLWVVIAAVLVLFMQAGFAMLEIGFSRAKNAGTGIAKILTNLSIAAICYWAVGFAFAFGAESRLGICGKPDRLGGLLPPRVRRRRPRRSR